MGPYYYSLHTKGVVLTVRLIAQEIGEPRVKGTYPIVAAYVIAIFLAMTAMVLWPRAGDPILVFVSPFESAQSADEKLYALLSTTEAKLVDKVSGHRFVVTSDDPDLAQKLFRNGAFLVMKANPELGCSAVDVPLETTPFRRT